MSTSSCSSGIIGSSPGGRALAKASATLGSRLGGKTTLNCRIILPFSNGFLYCGIPSPWICFRSPVLMTSPTSNSLDDESSVVQRINCLLHTSKRLGQVDVHLYDEV